MRRLLIQTILAVAVFSVGVGFSSLWFALRERQSRRASLQNDQSILGAETVASNPSEEYFQIGDDERRLGIRHYVRPRSEYAAVLGRLSEFVDLKARTKRNTFYIAK